MESLLKRSTNAATAYKLQCEIVQARIIYTYHSWQFEIKCQWNKWDRWMGFVRIKDEIAEWNVLSMCATSQSEHSPHPETSYEFRHVSIKTSAVRAAYVKCYGVRVCIISLFGIDAVVHVQRSQSNWRHRALY